MTDDGLLVMTNSVVRNLQMEYVDLYLIHHPVSMEPPDEAQREGPVVVVKKGLVALDMKGVWEEMEECHRRGLARAIGVSNFSCKKLEYLLSFAKIPTAVNQVEVNPCCRQEKLRQFCRSKGIQLCGYAAMGANGTAWANNSVMESPVLKQIAQDRSKTVAQVTTSFTNSIISLLLQLQH
jgi:diketogulonate reductase-like aldo/keto reductase